MALIVKPNTFSAGATITAATHNENFDTIYNDYNGNITNANISGSAAIADTKLAQITTANKVAAGAITDAAVDFTTVTQDSAHFEETTAPTTAAGEGALYTKDTGGQPELFYREESDGDEVQLTSGGSIGSNIVQTVYTSSVTYTNCATNIPFDDTLPQITEGDEVLSRAITPTSTSNYLLISVVLNIGTEADDEDPKCGALFNTDVHATNAVACGFFYNATGGAGQAHGGGTISFQYIVQAHQTTATTYTVRLGGNSSDAELNGYNGSRYYGGVLVSSITIQEFTP